MKCGALAYPIPLDGDHIRAPKAGLGTALRLDVHRMNWVPSQVPDCLIEARRILLVGQVPELVELSGGNVLRHIVRTHFSLVGASLLESVRPDTVIAPLIQPRWDCVDLACRLRDQGFTGTLIIDTAPLPCLEMVRREVLGLCPSLSVSVLIRVK